MTADESGKYTINKEHNYYQIQGQLHTVNCNRGFLVLWTQKETLIFQMEKDDTWSDNFDILKKFYFEHFLVHILTNDTFIHSV